MKKTKKLICFDFDGTLCMTPEDVEGKQIWFEKTGKPWPHRGWWGKPESLDTDIFEISVDKWVYDEYLNSVNDSDNHVILATGRLEPLRLEVEKILRDNNLAFDGVYLNPGADTFKFKTSLFEKLIFKLQPDEFIMFDDRDSHLVKFEDWAKLQSIHITIVDAKTHIKKTFHKN